MEKFIAPLIVLLVLGIVILVIIFVIRRKIERFSNSLFGTKSLAEGWKRQAEDLAATPKSVSGMTRLLEPQIQKDFPEFNWMQFKNKAENMLVSSFAAISEGNPQLLKESTPELRDQIENQINANKADGITETYRDVHIHQTEIARYEKKQGKCVITLQSAVAYMHSKKRDGKVIAGSQELLEQTKYNIELMYLQNVEAANMDKSLGMTCPHCGAPITGLGEKRCEYCGSTVTPINIQVWNLQRFYQVDYHRV